MFACFCGDLDSFAPAGQSLEAIASMLQNRAVPIELRPALEHDFAYCRRLYFGEMRWMVEELRLDRTAQETSFRQQWNSTQVRIIVLDGADVGWVQTIREEDELFVAQMFVDSRFQRRGIGTEVMKRLISEATAFNLAVRLNVVRINPARRLYERLGFRVTHEDDRKFYMKRNADVV
jgi:GNAT superfamily N-acetyltransferase